jgi:hypothetical protein
MMRLLLEKKIVMVFDIFRTLIVRLFGTSPGYTVQFYQCARRLETMTSVFLWPATGTYRPDGLLIVY